MRWTHPDPRMDRLHRDVSRLVEQPPPRRDAAVTFDAIRRLAYEAAGRPAPAVDSGRAPLRPAAHRALVLLRRAQPRADGARDEREGLLQVIVRISFKA